MPESAESYLALEEVRGGDLSLELTELLDAVVDVARRLDHNVLSPEHLLVVGAENGVEEMSRLVPSLAAFREALLDSLFDDREMFRFAGSAEGQQLYVKPELAGIFRRMEAGEQAPELLEELMQSGSPRIDRALSYARGSEPDVLPPDTITLDQLMESADPGETAATAAAEEPDAAALDLPLMLNLGEDTADDPPMVMRGSLADQVARILLRFHQPSVLLVGPPGSGKTAFVRSLARAATDGSLPALDGMQFHQLKLLDLVSQGHRGQDVHQIVDQLFTLVGSFPNAVMVIDDLHLLVAKQGYPLMSDLIDTVKMHIAKGKVRALLTVDANAYKGSLANDSFFSNQITVRTMPAAEREDLTRMVEAYRPRLQEHFQLPIGDDALTVAVEASLSEDLSDYMPPGATIRILDEASAMARAEGAEAVAADHVRRCVSEEPHDSSHVDRQRLRDIESFLGQRVLGQELAAGAIGRRVRLAKLHLDRKPERPDGVFLFMGPSGVGKTEMARALARALYGDESRLVRIDMSEYMEPHSVARIIGAPPGYVGYGEGGALTAPVAELGHAVVLLDEIEKAHPRVLNLFLQVFDDGRLTDSQGRVVNFSDTVVIMTSNIGRELYAIHGQPAIGFGGGDLQDDHDGRPLRSAVQDHLLRVLPSEFVSRIDEVIPFRVLEDDDIVQIAHRILETEVERWRARGKEVTYDDEVVAMIATTDYDARLGARHVERNLERFVSSLMSDAAVSDGFDLVRKMDLTVKDDAICLELDGTPFVCLHDSGQVIDGQRPADDPPPA